MSTRPAAENGGTAGAGAAPGSTTPRSGGPATPRSANVAGAHTPRGGGGTSPHGSKEGVKGGSATSGGAGQAGQGGKEVAPPRRVQKNPSFLQQHRDRYGNHHRQLRGAKDDHKRPAGDEAGARGAGAGESRKKKFLHGNYDTYYSYRNPGAQDDPRIKVLERAWIDGKRVLDVGCNSGAITIEVARAMQPRHIMGVDIDPSLIQKARINLRALALKLHAQQQGTAAAAHQDSTSDKCVDEAAHSAASGEVAAGAPPAPAGAAAGVDKGAEAGDQGKGAAGGSLSSAAPPPLSAISHRGVEVRKVGWGRGVRALSLARRSPAAVAAASRLALAAARRVALCPAPSSCQLLGAGVWCCCISPLASCLLASSLPT